MTAAKVTLHSIFLIWIKPHDNNAPILGYNVSIESDLGEKNAISTRIESANISGLTSGIVYTFNVTAFNEIGVSYPSTLRVRTLSYASGESKTISVQWWSDLSGRSGFNQTTLTLNIAHINCACILGSTSKKHISLIVPFELTRQLNI